MNKLHLPKFNLDITLLGGQAFSWIKNEDVYYGKVKDSVVKIIREDDDIYWQTFPKKDDFELLKKYLRLDIDYESILENISKDEFVKMALDKQSHIRLLKQDFEETLFSFLISQNSNIPKIRGSIEKISQMYGNKIKVDDKEFYLFPSTEFIADLSIERLMETRIGYRAPYLKRSAQQILENNLASNIESLNYEDSKKELIKLHGVGDKVADCILVFSLVHDHVTPLDVWAKRALTDLYKLDPKMKYSEMLEFLNKKFGNHTSWAGQFLFEYIRTI